MTTGTSQPTQTPPEARNLRIRIPFRITLLLILVLITTVFSAVRCLTAIGWGRTLQSYMPAALDIYVAVSGAFWTLAGCFVLWSVLRGRRHSSAVILFTGGAYALWFWLDRLLIQPGGHPNWAFDLLVTALVLIYTGAVALDPHNQIFFDRERYERKP